MGKRKEGRNVYGIRLPVGTDAYVIHRNGKDMHPAELMRMAAAFDGAGLAYDGDDVTGAVARLVRAARAMANAHTGPDVIASRRELVAALAAFELEDDNEQA